MRNARWGLVVTIAAATALALLASPALAKRRGGADLVVAGGKLTGDPFVFYGGAHQPHFSLTAVTSNHGAAVGPTVTTVYLEHQNRRWRLADRSVPALGPGARDRGRATVVHEPRLPLGGYTVTICADAKSKVAEANERNNCKHLGDHFYVVATDWTGTVSGTNTLGPLFDEGPAPGDKSLERWQSSDADYFFDEYRGDGVFRYDLVGAHFSFTDGGTDEAGCNYSGGGSSGRASGSVQLDYLGGAYSADAGIPEFYPIHVVCPAPEGHHSEIDLEGPYENLLLLDTEAFGGAFPRPRRLAFGAFKLAGTNAGRELGANWAWSLEAAKP
ncbi:MAG TPA: CARDB domain-containing protein [Solirubrobacterales bacterium]|nr:CARDB domain-containing protein [Solirubrobacterales bacterium]